MFYYFDLLLSSHSHISGLSRMPLFLRPDLCVRYLRIPLRWAVSAPLLLYNWWVRPDASGFRKSG
jgi:hypothetical protein